MVGNDIVEDIVGSTSSASEMSASTMLWNVNFLLYDGVAKGLNYSYI